MNNGENNGQFSVTKVGIFIAATTTIVTFLGILPKLTPFFALSLSAFSLPFPKIWVLLTATFFHENVLFGLFSVILVLLVSKQIEPLMGSKEFLRMFVTIGFYTNIVVVIFAGIALLITGNLLISARPFITSEAPLSAITIWLSHEFINMKIPTMCGNLRVRMIPFYSFVIQLLFSLLGTIDGLLASIIAYTLTYLYIRYIKRNGRSRGDPTFSPLKLLPSCCSPDPDDDDSDDNNGPGIPPMGMAGFQPQMADETENIDRFRYNNNPTPTNRNNNQTQNRFQGAPRTINP